VMALCGVVAFFMCGLPFYADAARYPDTVLSSPYLPVILSMLAGYIVSECFFNVRARAPPPPPLGRTTAARDMGPRYAVWPACRAGGRRTSARAAHRLPELGQHASLVSMPLPALRMHPVPGLRAGARVPPARDSGPCAAARARCT